MTRILVIGPDAEDIVTLLRLRGITDAIAHVPEQTAVVENLAAAGYSSRVFAERTLALAVAMEQCSRAASAAALAGPKMCDALRTRRSKGDRKRGKADRWC